MINFFKKIFSSLKEPKQEIGKEELEHVKNIAKRLIVVDELEASCEYLIRHIGHIKKFKENVEEIEIIKSKIRNIEK